MNNYPCDISWGILDMHTNCVPWSISHRARIERHGGFVSSDGRLDGRLQVSRSLGDRQLKKVRLTFPPAQHDACQIFNPCLECYWCA